VTDHVEETVEVEALAVVLPPAVDLEREAGRLSRP
jgi:hypothetical protein